MMIEMQNIDFTIKRIKAYLEQCKLPTYTLSKISGVPYSTLQGLRKGMHGSNTKTLLKLESIIPSDFKPDV